MPRSVICSPSHMMKTEPVVSVRTVKAIQPAEGSVTIGTPAGRRHLRNRQGQTERLKAAQSQGQVARDLIHLLSALLAFFGQPVEIRDHMRALQQG